MKQVIVSCKTTIDKTAYYGGVRLVDDDVAQALVATGNAKYLSESDKPKAVKVPEANPVVNK